MTNVLLTNKALVPNIALRQAIDEWREQQPLAIDPERLHLSEEVIGGFLGQVLVGTLEMHGRQQQVAVKLLPAMSQVEVRKQFDLELKHHCTAKEPHYEASSLSHHEAV